MLKMFLKYLTQPKRSMNFFNELVVKQNQNLPRNPECSVTGNIARTGCSISPFENLLMPISNWLVNSSQGIALSHCKFVKKGILPTADIVTFCPVFTVWSTKLMDITEINTYDWSTHYTCKTCFFSGFVFQMWQSREGA